MRIDLKPCPFCGGEGELFERWARSGDKAFCFVKCETCGVQTRPAFINNAGDLDDEELDLAFDDAARKVSRRWNARTND